MNDGQLFDTPSGRQMSADQKRNERNRQLIIRGVHPVTRQDIRDGAETCGNCANIKGRTYKKCKLVNYTSGPATDIRSGWPACHLWEPKP